MLAGLAAVGVGAVQVRVKQLSDRDLLAFTVEVVTRLRHTDVQVIVNDRLDVALAAGAHGVHLGADDLPVAQARRIAPDGFLVGGTCRSLEQARRAKDEGADYVGVGPIYPSTSKTGLPGPVGLSVLRATAQVLPVIAISGITVDRVPEVMSAGAYGVAVLAAVCGAGEPRHAAKQIVDAVRCA